MADYKCAPLNRIPWDVAKSMKEVAAYASWHAANHFAGKDGDAARDVEAAGRHYDTLCCYGLFSNRFCELFKDMAWAAAWSAANERMGTTEEAVKNKDNWNLYHQALTRTKETTIRIADELKYLCWNSAWHCANTRAHWGLFTSGDAARDAERIELHYNNIGSECKLVSLEFINEKAKITDTVAPKFFAQQKLENRSDSPQEMSVQFSHYTTQTKSWGRDVRWGFTVAGGVITCLFNILGGYIGIFNLDKGFSGDGATGSGEVKTYTFPVRVGPKSTVKAKGVVQETTAEVPYFMEFDMGGSRYCRAGTWKGVVTGNVELRIGETVKLK